MSFLTANRARSAINTYRRNINRALNEINRTAPIVMGGNMRLTNTNRERAMIEIINDIRAEFGFILSALDGLEFEE